MGVALAQGKRLRAAGLPALGAAASVLAAVAVGYPTHGLLVAAGAVVGGCALFIALRFPFAALLVLVPSTILQIVVALPGGRGLNAFDVLLLPALAGSILGGARERARAAASREESAGHEVERAARDFHNAVLLFFGLAFLSLLPGLLTGRAADSADSFLILMRGIQGLSLYPLCLWWLRSMPRLAALFRAAVIGAIAFSVANIVAITFWGTRRAGLSWVLNADYVPMNGPNEAAMAMLFVGVLMLARQSSRRNPWNILVLALTLVMLILTQSRSGLLAWLVVALLSFKRSRLKWMLAGLGAILMALPLVPDVFWRRVVNTLVLERGSFEAYSSLVRVFGWKAAWQMFLDHPLFGVGYLGFRFFSEHYNDLGVILGTAESYYLETATGMGIIGLAALTLTIIAMYRLGIVIARTATPGSLAHAMGRYHAPFISGLLVANITGDNFVGMVGLAQLAVWNGVMLMAARLQGATGDA